MIWLCGKDGMLAREFSRVLSNKKRDFIATGHEVDCASWKAVKDFFLSHKHNFENDAQLKKTNWIINCTGFTNVDACEVEKKRAIRENVTTVKNLARLSKKHKLRLLHFSSDYVFDGKKNSAYTENDKAHPINFYGKTKLQSERVALKTNAIVIRTSALFGNDKSNFVSKIISALQNQKCVRVVDDEFTKPTSAHSLAKVSLLCMETNLLRGVYHFAESPSISRFCFANEIAHIAKDKNIIEKNCKVLPCKKSDLQMLAFRPACAILSCEKIENALGIKIASWRDELAIYNLQLIMNN